MRRILQLDNFRVLRGYGWKGFRKMRMWRQDEGHKAEIRTFIRTVREAEPAPIAFDEIVGIK